MKRAAAGVTRTLRTGPGIRGGVALAMLLVACASAPSTRHNATVVENPPRYSLVFVIHGDGDYVYHDTAGVALRADEEMVARAQHLAGELTNAEVVIFHEIERKHVLFVIPRHDGRAYYYRNGRLMAQESYWRDQGPGHFDPEARLFRNFTGDQPRPSVNLFLYFGHELPENNTPGYDASYPDRPVGVGDLTECIRSITEESGKLGLLVLGTCYGGTPHTINALSPYARYIVASPENLHLSYFDLESLTDLNTANGDMAALARGFARSAFDRLVGEVQTAVSVVVYDTDRTRAFTGQAIGPYDRGLADAAAMPAAASQRCDCATNPAYDTASMHNGTTVLYRAARFGRRKDQRQHSGWECLRTAD